MKRLFPKVLGGMDGLAIAVSVWSGAPKAAPETFNTALPVGTGEFVFRGQVCDELEGSSDHPMTVVLKFPDRASALEWYNSPDYQEAVALRQAAADSVVVIYEDM